MKVIKIRDALKQLKTINDEIRYADCARGKNFRTGLIAFRPRKRADFKQIRHRDKDVVCHVLRGRGRLRIDRRRIALSPGVICHIRKGTPHDFVAVDKDLVLFYSLIQTA
jgi:quercetin dioxygenase-like cupin family protein